MTDKNGLYVDCTYGRGGHSKEILKNLHKKGRLYSFDLDPEAALESTNIKNKNFNFIHDNFSNLENYFDDKYLNLGSSHLMENFANERSDYCEMYRILKWVE